MSGEPMNLVTDEIVEKLAKVQHWRETDCEHWSEAGELSREAWTAQARSDIELILAEHAKATGWPPVIRQLHSIDEIEPAMVVEMRGANPDISPHIAAVRGLVTNVTADAVRLEGRAGGLHQMFRLDAVQRTWWLVSEGEA